MPVETSEGSADMIPTGDDLGFDPDGLEPESEEVSSEGESEEASSSEDQGEEPKGEPEPEKAESEEAKPPEEAKAEEPEAAPVPEKFSFLDRDYDTKEEAERAFKSYLGQIGPKDKRISELETELLQRTDQLNRLLQESQQRGQPESKAEPKKPLKLSGAVDLDLYRQLCEDKGPDYGLQYVLGEQEKVLDRMLEERFGEKLTSQLKPLQDWHEQMATFNRTAELFQQIADRVDNGGKYLFPELRESPEFVEKVAKYWKNIPKHEDLGAHGVYLATLAVRDWERYNKAGEPLPPPPPAEVKPTGPSASEAINRLNQQTQKGTNEGVVTGTGMPRPAVGPADSYESRIKRELREAAENYDPILGFEPS